jgi:hypothetical protein
VLLLLLLPKVLLSLLVLRQVVDILPRQHPRQIRFAVSLESVIGHCLLKPQGSTGKLCKRTANKATGVQSSVEKIRPNLAGLDCACCPSHMLAH